MDRAIHIKMERKAKGSAIEKLRARKVRPSFEEIGSKLARWAADNREQLVGAEPVMPDGLDDRAEDIWEPLIAIADFVGDDWPVLARRAALALSGGRDNDDPSIDLRLLADIRSVFTGEQMWSAELCQALAELEEAPWAKHRSGRDPIDPNSLARILRRFAVASKNVRIGTDVKKGYSRRDLELVFERYLSPESALEDATALQEVREVNEEQPKTPTAVAPLAARAVNSESGRYTPLGQGRSAVNAGVQVQKACSGVAAQPSESRSERASNLGEQSAKTVELVPSVEVDADAEEGAI